MKTITKRELINLLEEDELKNYNYAFDYAISIGHLDTNEGVWMYMGFENNTIFFKDKITRAYNNLELI